MRHDHEYLAKKDDYERMIIDLESLVRHKAIKVVTAVGNVRYMEADSRNYSDFILVLASVFDGVRVYMSHSECLASLVTHIHRVRGLCLCSPTVLACIGLANMY